MSMRIKSDPSVSRAMNRRLLLSLLRRHGAMSRARLAVDSGLSAPAVTDVVSDLIAEGYLIEGQTSRGAVGRRPVPVSLNYGGRIAIGVKLMVDAIQGVVTDLSTTPIGAASRHLPDSRPETFVAGIAATVTHLRLQAGAADAPLLGVGVSLPGVIDTQRGICIRSARLGWGEVPLAAMVAERTGTSVWLEDDTNAFALAQHLFGPGRHHANLAALAIGAGISCAIVADGKLYRGSHGVAGKLGHVLHDADGPLCECGRRGCLQAWHSERAIVTAWETRTAGSLGTGSAAMVAALNRPDPDPVAVATLAEAGAAIGRHLATFVNIVDPAVIIVGGEAVAFGDPLFEPMRRTLAQHTFAAAPPIYPDWDDSSWARGAAALATQRVFDFEQTGIERDVVARPTSSKPLAG